MGTSQVRFGPAVDGIVPALIARFKGIPIARTVCVTNTIKRLTQRRNQKGIPCSSNTLGIGRCRRRRDYQTHGPLTWCRTTTMTATTVATSRRPVATSPSTHRTATTKHDLYRRWKQSDCDGTLLCTLIVANCNHGVLLLFVNTNATSSVFIGWQCHFDRMLLYRCLCCV